MPTSLLTWSSSTRRADIAGLSCLLLLLLLIFLCGTATTSAEAMASCSRSYLTSWVMGKLRRISVELMIA
jgi:hypothetical protein